MIKYSKLSVGKAANQIKLLVIFCIYCYVVGRIFENLTGRVIFNFAGLLLWIHVQILFNMFGFFGRIFFQTALLAASLKKECWINKNLFCNYSKCQEILRQDVFPPGMKYLHGKYDFEYAGIPPWTNGIPPSREGVKNFSASCKRNNQFMKK